MAYYSCDDCYYCKSGTCKKDGCQYEGKNVEGETACSDWESKQ